MRENVLRDPGRVTFQDYQDHLGPMGRTWVYERNGTILGFSAVTRAPASIWALFVDPAHERRGIGRQLLDCAIAWLQESGAREVVLTTWPGTRADTFYRAAGWLAGANSAGGEVSFTLHLADDRASTHSA